MDRYNRLWILVQPLIVPATALVLVDLTVGELVSVLMGAFALVVATSTA